MRQHDCGGDPAPYEGKSSDSGASVISVLLLFSHFSVCVFSFLNLENV